MEGNLSELLHHIKGIENSMEALHKRAEGIEKRLEGLEKMDSIEHRVTSNQIDITDIKDALERLEEFQIDKLEKAITQLLQKAEEKNTNEFSIVHKRLDSHLLKLGRVEEEMLMVQQQK